MSLAYVDFGKKSHVTNWYGEKYIEVTANAFLQMCTRAEQYRYWQREAEAPGVGGYGSNLSSATLQQAAVVPGR